MGGKPRDGTSPPTRGKPGEAQEAHAARRNIPAYTGKTMRAGKCITSAPEHPRLHGENCTMISASESHSGTSPPTRGKRHQRRVGHLIPRNIPAHTGKTWGNRPTPAIWAEHPRPHGENAVHRVVLNAPDGTSPPTRGKPSSCQAARPPPGLWYLPTPRFQITIPAQKRARAGAVVRAPLPPFPTPRPLR